MPEGVSKHDLGDVRLKDMDESERVVQLAIDGLPSSFPPLRAGREEPIDFGERLAERIEADVEKRIEASLTGQGDPFKAGVAGTRLALLGLVNLVLLAAAVVAIVLLVKRAF